MAYITTWTIIAIAALVGLFGFYRLLREFVGSAYLRVLCCGLIFALVLTPAPIPGYPQHYAPAFIVAIFEGIFQRDGAPWVALRFLIAGSLATGGLITLGAIGWRNWNGRRASDGDEPAPGQADGDIEKSPAR